MPNTENRHQPQDQKSKTTPRPDSEKDRRRDPKSGQMHQDDPGQRDRPQHGNEQPRSPERK